MAKQDETLIDRIEGCVRSLHFTRKRIDKALVDLAELERHLPKDVEIRTMFKLLIRSIAEETKHIGISAEMDKM